MKLSEALIQAKALISDKQHWVRGWYAFGLTSYKLQPGNPAACRFCSKGALLHLQIIHRLSMDFYASMETALSKNMDGSIVLFNDAKQHDEVMSAWDKAIYDAQVKEYYEVVTVFD